MAAVRGRLGFTQAQFAARFGFSVATLRHWARGDRRPQCPALVLLNLIDRDPKNVLKVLSFLTLAFVHCLPIATKAAATAAMRRQDHLSH